MFKINLRKELFFFINIIKSLEVVVKQLIQMGLLPIGTC